MTPCAIVVITFNEEPNIAHALKSVVSWADEVFVVDALSTDRTAQIARSLGAKVVSHPFESVGCQRNWAIDNLPIESRWVLFLDADEYLSEEMKEEITSALRHDDGSVSGFFTKIKFIYLGRWLKHGDLYGNLIRMVRKGSGRYVDTEGFHEKMVVDGQVRQLTSYIVHHDRKGLADWIAKQMPRIAIDAAARLSTSSSGSQARSSNANDTLTMEGGKSRSLREKLYILPAPVRPFAQFFYRYILRLGFLDGWQGLIYNFLLQFWYPMMVEATYLELKQQHSQQGSSTDISEKTA